MSELGRPAGPESLEEVFLSGGFSRAPGASLATPALPAALRQGDAPDHQLEEVLLSDSFGQEAEARRVEAPEGEVGTLSPIRAMPAWRIRYRAAAAASSVAAAAMVVSVMASGGGPPGLPTIAAAGPGAGTQGGRSGGVGAAGPASRGSPAAAASVLASATGRPTFGGGGSSSAGVAFSSSGHVAAAPSSVPADTPSRGGAVAPVGAAPPPSPPATPSPPGSEGGVSGLTSAGSSSVNAISTAVTSAADQLGNTVPASTSAVGAINGAGATVTGLGQAMGLSTA